MGATPHYAADLPPPRRRRNLSFYLVLLFLAGPVWSVVPASWAYVFFSLYHLNILAYTAKGYVLFALACSEVLFSVYYYACIRRVASYSTPRTSHIIDLQEAFKRVLQSGLASLPEHGGDEEEQLSLQPASPTCTIERLERHDERAIDFRVRLRTWFGKAPWSRVRLEHMHQWLYWSTFNAALPPHDELPKSHRFVIDEAVELIERRVGCKIPRGSDPSVKALLLTIDPVNILHRPLVWYLLVKLGNMYVRSRYEGSGKLTYGRFNNLEYLIHVPANYDREAGPDPIVFLHGLGLGIFQYQRVITHILKELPQYPLLIPIQPQISQDFFHPRFLQPMLRSENVDCLTGLLNELGWAGPSVGDRYGITLLSHSNGSFVHAWILKSRPDLVRRSCFVDPVTFCSWEGDVCYNFIYRACTTGVELIIRYFVGTELGVANVLQRHFNWLDNSLFFEEVPSARDPARAFFLLGGKDSILDAERVKKYLTSHGVRKGLFYDPRGRHGEALLVGAQGITRVIDWIREHSGICRTKLN